LLVGGLGFVAFLLLRLWDRDTHPEEPAAASKTERSETFENWLAAAQACAAAGEFARAIQCAYWAAITRLQFSGSLPRDATCTPREFLHLAKHPDILPPLKLLTSSLEAFWYAGGVASPDDFATCLKSLEALGCKMA
jgi:hypothetical protein